MLLRKIFNEGESLKSEREKKYRLKMKQPHGQHTRKHKKTREMIIKPKLEGSSERTREKEKETRRNKE